MKVGGHAMAAGLSLKKINFHFSASLSALMAELVSAEQLQGVILTDGELSDSQLSLPIAEMLKKAGPWGQAFPEPLSMANSHLTTATYCGKQTFKNDASTINSHVMIDAVAFNVDVNMAG